MRPIDDPAAQFETVLPLSRRRLSRGPARHESLESLILLPADMEACEEAGHLGAQLLARGETICGVDLLIAATSKRHGQRLLTRDRSLARVPGLSFETY